MKIAPNCLIILILFGSLTAGPASTWTVTNPADSGPGTLRQALADAMAGDTIDFNVTGTITLGAQLVIDRSLTIAGPGATNLTVRGNGGTRLFSVSAGPTVISGLTLAYGLDWFESTSGGGAILNTAALTLRACELVHNQSTVRGGAVLNLGVSATLVANDCTFAENSMTWSDGGGAIWNNNLLRVTNCTFSANYSGGNGGAVDTRGDAAIVNCTIVGNDADFGIGGGIYNGGGTLALENTIVAGNYYFFHIDPNEVAGGITSGDYNLIQHTNDLVVPGTHNVLGQDPILGDLTYLGGFTRTHGLASISPALDVADGASSPATDQRGVSRPQGAGFDIGSFEGALPQNHSPLVNNLIPDQFSTYQAAFNYVLPADTFSDIDAGQTLTWSVANLPAGLLFDPPTRTISGTFSTAGTNPITVTARDNGAPPLSTNTTLNLIAPKLLITARADDVSRILGNPDPLFTITYYGLAAGDAPWMIDNPPSAITTATSTSPPGIYPIVLSGGFDDVYSFGGLTNGTLTVTLWPLRAAAANATRGVGQTNQPFLGLLTGVLYGDHITATYLSAATPASGAGDYPIIPVLHDPLGRLTNYDLTLVNGTLTVESDARNPDFQVLHAFGFTNRIGSTTSELIEGSDGWLYGAGGGVNGMGVFKIQKDGTGFIVVRSFTPAEGSPAGPLLEHTDGLLYGGGGSVWSMNRDGSGFTVLHPGAASGLLKGSDGMLYGIGGDGVAGTVFRLEMDGSNYTVLHTFDASYLEGLSQSQLIEGTNGMLYGTASAGGPGGYYGDGTVFSLNKDGSNFSVLHSFIFGATDGAAPKARLLQGSDGKLYGTTRFGGPGYGGTIFAINLDGSGYALVKTFDYYNPIEGITPTAPLIESGGLLFGTTTERGPTSYGGTAFKMNKDGSSFTVLKQFADSNGDVWDPEFGLLETADGTLYGAASRGGNLEFNQISGGVFKLNKDGSNYALLHPFTRTGGDGRGSLARASEGSDGMIYGTTQFGGTRDIGTIFRMDKNGNNYAVLHSFTGATNDGSHPATEVIEASDGMIYGTTLDGGTNLAGTLFRVNKDGTSYVVLRSFDGNDGSAPKGGLAEGSDHRLYGTTSLGVSLYNGTVFSLNKDGTGFATLVSFDGTNGWSPESTLVEDSNGVLYGTTSGGYGGQGSAFKLNLDGSAFAVLHAFDYSLGESIQPVGGLLLASDGVLYGTASDRYGSGYGAVFQLNRDGTGFQTLHQFGVSEMDGRNPTGVLVEGADGRIYGVTSYGGVFRDSYYPQSGTIFRLRKDGSGYSVIHHFGTPTSPGGSFLPVDGKGPLFRGSDGSLYALSPNGLPLDFGFVYRLVFPANLPPALDLPIADQGGNYGVPFNFTFAANTFSDPDAGQKVSYAAGNLPPGVTFDEPSRSFSGSPTNAGTYSVTVTATDDGTPPLSTDDVFDIVVTQASLIVTANNKSKLSGQLNPPLDGTLMGVTNHDNITATFTTTAETGSPAGIYPITPVFTDTANRLPNYTITTNLGMLTVLDCSALTITNSVLPNATEGMPYSVTLFATNGTGPYTFAVSAGTLPGNLTLAADGLLSGTALMAGNFPFTVTVTGIEGCTVSSNFLLAVACPVITVSPGTLPPGVTNVPYNQLLSASGGTAPYTFTVTSGSLPTGLVLANSGNLSGMLTATGSFAFTVTAADAGGCTASAGFSISIFNPYTFYVRLKSFGFPDRSAASPYSAPIEGSDGALYGTTATGGDNGLGTVYRVNKDASGYRVLRSFSETFSGGYAVRSGLAEGSDGVLYGTTVGTVFKLNRDGSGYAVLHQFGGGGDGSTCFAGLMEGSDGALYGTTTGGGNAGGGGFAWGTVFKLSKNGSGYAILKSFAQNNGDSGGVPYAGLIQGTNGVLYGTTTTGGANGVGTVFKVNTNGTGYAVLRSFSNAGGDARSPEAGLVEGSDGALYGTTVGGGGGSRGAVFKLNKDGTGYTVLRNFTGTSAGGDGANPHAVLVEGSDGALYGTTANGGNDGSDFGGGTIFKLNKDGSGYAILRSFTGNNNDGDGRSPNAGLVKATDGSLYGTTTLGSGGSYAEGTLFKINENGGGYALVVSFSSNGDDATRPQALVVEGTDGMLYGTTHNGGAGRPSAGTVFKMSKDGSGYTLLWGFTNSDYPSGVIEGRDGALYGTTENGGNSFVGTVFKLNQNGSGYTILRNFSSTGSDGQYPSAGVIQGGDGVLYGTARQGGSANAGTVFKLNTNGTGYATIRNFLTTGGDGRDPIGLTEGVDGVLYGTTASGGGQFVGTVFKLNKNGTGYGVLRSFSSSGSDGQTPSAVLVQGSDGVLYGTTYSGGSAGVGTVFKLSTNGTGYAVLRSFATTGGDGKFPQSPLVEAGDGVLYGTTSDGGVDNVGTLFKLNKNGTGYAVLRSFSSVAGDGQSPIAGLMRGSDGVLYGSTSMGGQMNLGTLFKLASFPFAPSVIAQPQSRTNPPASTVTFSSVALGTETLSYRWRKGGVNLVNGGNVSGATTNSLTLTGISSGDAGNYTVVITNIAGSVTSSVAALTVTNQAPLLTSQLPDRTNTYGSTFSYTFPKNFFVEPDAGQTLSYTASGLPPGLAFTGATRTFNGTNTSAGTFAVTVIATDSGVPSLSTNGTFNILVAKAPLTVSANNTNRPYGEADPAFTGTLVGVTNNDNLTTTFSTTATLSSAPGDYPITPALQDPDSRLGNYSVTTNNGTLSINGVTLEFSLSGGSASFCWPTTAAAFLVEYTDDLTPPVTWQSISTGIATNGPNICFTVIPEAVVSSRFYRLRLP